MPLSDKQGNSFYTAKEAWEALKVSRSTFEKWAEDKKIQKYKRKADRRIYYRVEDVESLKPAEDEFFPIKEEKTNGGRAALAFA